MVALPVSDRPIWATAFYAGLRRGELQALQPSDVDLASSEITVNRSWDQYEPEAAKREGREPVLLRPITLHECRHTFASLLIDANVNAKAIQEFMGHATIEETFSRYGHLMPGARDQARELIDAYLHAPQDAALAA